MKITNRTVPILYKDINFEELSDGDVFASKDGLRIFMKIGELNQAELNWAFTTCKKGFNPLTRVNESGDIKKYYDGRSCPICGRKITCDTSLLIDAEEDEDE